MERLYLLWTVLQRHIGFPGIALVWMSLPPGKPPLRLHLSLLQSSGCVGKGFVEESLLGGALRCGPRGLMPLCRVWLHPSAELNFQPLNYNVMCWRNGYPGEMLGSSRPPLMVADWLNRRSGLGSCQSGTTRTASVNLGAPERRSVWSFHS
jgi:hypothetical protein